MQSSDFAVFEAAGSQTKAFAYIGYLLTIVYSFFQQTLSGKYDF